MDTVGVYGSRSVELPGGTKGHCEPFWVRSGHAVVGTLEAHRKIYMRPSCSIDCT